MVLVALGTLVILVALVAFHVGIFDFPRGYFLFSTWGRNDSSEVSFDSSEVLFRLHVEIYPFPRGDLKIPTWRFIHFF